MANDEPNTDQDINTVTPNRPDEYAIKYGRASNPDLDVAGDNDKTGPSNAATGGGLNNDLDADTGTGGQVPVMRRGGELAESDVMSAGVGPDAGPGDVPQEPTDTTIGENYSTGPRRTDPEEELLDPDYEAQISGNTTQDTMGPDRAGHRVLPGLGGLPDQAGTLDQTTYSSQGDTLGTDTDAGSGSGTGQP
jgi:hypothetical protein